MPTTMSFTSTVPASVPSVCHSSLPFTGSDALKYKLPFTFVRYRGDEPAAPGLISFTRVVPATVPSVFQSSLPATPSFAVKNSVPFTLHRLAGEGLLKPP